MVSINISTSLQGTLKSEDSSNDSDNSSVDNIFASMLSLVEDDRNPLKSNNALEVTEDTIILLEELKKKLGLSGDGDHSKSLDEKSSKILSTDILKIYQTYKTLIDNPLNIKKDATITFDVEKSLDLSPTNEQSSSDNLVKPKKQTELMIKNLEKLSTPTEDLVLDKSMKEFSELEMRRIKASTKQTEQTNFELDKINKKAKSDIKDGQSLSIKNIFEQKENSGPPPLTKVTSLADQIKIDINQLNLSLDNSRTESILEHGQSANKATTSKVNSSDLNPQGTNDASHAHLKLLEKNWGKDLAKIIEKAILSGKGKIDISLEPQRLGRMHLTMSLANNQTSIFISTENAAASLILSSAEDRLAQMFESSGYKLSNFQANSNRNNNSDRNGHGSKRNKEEKGTLINKEQPFFPEKANHASHSINGRKVINIIA